MKSPSSFRARAGAVVGVAVLGVAMLGVAELPVIESIHVESTHLVVTAQVPPGYACVKLESRDRLREGTWAPVAVRRVDGQGGTLTFRLPRSADFGVLRVRAETTETLPASFYTGTNAFTAQPASGMYDALGAFGGPRGEDGAAREVTESDIWRLDGDTLYFFNQYRGLQVIDVNDPDAASVRGTLNLPAAGEQMYLLPPSHVLLLAQGQCGGYSPYANGTDASQVLIVAVDNGVPSVVANLPVAGTIAESRLVGSALYVASQTMRAVPASEGTTWEWGMQISSFDLAQPAKPETRSTQWYPGYGNVVHATDTYLFAITAEPSNWRQSIVNVLDITSPDGMMRAHATIRPAGRVADKFKLDWTDGIFSVISEVSATPRLTKLETFRLPDPRTLPPFTYLRLGEVEVGHGEALFATRFDYPRAYVVTFLRIDPLWVVDLTDPARPTVSGELEVPGWSTYIHPRGQQLVAVGVETNRTTVSLFDVADPQKPALLDRVQLGNQYSWSEANRDEKAFTVLEDAGLILLPAAGYTGSGYSSWVQLIDLGEQSLTLRGRIEHQFTPRRATLHRDRVVSLSGVELLSVDATDRDHPKLTGRLDLAWSINRVLLAGEYLLEVTVGDSWSADPIPAVRVAPALEPDTVLVSLSLTNAPVVGAIVQRDRLYLVQASSQGGPVILGSETDSPPTNTLWLTVLDLSNLPSLSVLGQTAVTTDPLGWNSELTPLWLQPELLVWVGGGNNYYWWGPWDMAMRDGPIGFAPWYWPYPQSGGGGRLFAFDVSEDASPALLSEVDLTTHGWWNFSLPFVADGRVYLSHQAYVEIKTNDPAGIIVGWPTSYQRSFLDVVDYADARHPTVRPPVSIPGTLQGISHAGALLYTIGFHHISTNFWEGVEALDASAYDGISAHLVDSLSLSNIWMHPARVNGTNVFLGRVAVSQDPQNPIPPTLETWTLSSAGRFARLASVTLSGAAYDLVEFPGLLAAQVDGSRVQVFDSSDPAALRLVGEGPMAGCFYFNLHHADAAPGRAIWLPLGAFGVTRLSLSP